MMQATAGRGHTEAAGQGEAAQAGGPPVDHAQRPAAQPTGPGCHPTQAQPELQ